MAARTKKKQPKTVIIPLTTLWVLLAVVLATTLVRLPLLNIPFERDEGEYAYIAWRMDYGEVPYKDWVDQKPPAIFWLYRLAFALPLAPIAGVHLTALLWSAASACALFYLARRFMDSVPAGLSAILFSVLLADPMINGAAANTELFMLLPLLLSQLVFFHTLAARRRQLLLAVLCGILIGMATAFKQVAAVNWVLLLAMYPVFAPKTERLKATIKFACGSALGIAVVWTLIAAWFCAHHGFDDFFYQVVTHNLQYAASLSWAKRWKNFQLVITRLTATQLLVWLAAALALVMPRPIGGGKWRTFVGVWLLTSFIGVSASGYFFPHYFQQLLPALCLAAVMGAERLIQIRSLTSATKRNLRIATAALLLLVPVWAIYPYLTSYSLDETLKRIYPGNFFAVMPALGQRLAEATKPEDKVYIFGAEPELLFYARRASATRYIFLFPLYGPYPDALEKQKRVADEVAEARPAAALYSLHELLLVPGSEQYLTRWTQDYFRNGYQPDTYVTRDRVQNVSLAFSNNGLPPIAPRGQGVQAILLLRENR